MADISAPNPAAYGIWGPAFAQALAAQTNSPVAGPLNMLAMRGYMGGEMGGYQEALANTQQNQLALARQEAEGKLQQALIEQAAPLAAQGATGFMGPAYEQFGVNTNVPAGTAVDQLHAQDIAAGIFKERATGTADMAAVGYAPPAAQVNDTLMPATVTAPLPEFVPYMSPDALNDQMRAEAAKTSAAADMVSANRPRGGSGGGGAGGVAYTITPPLFPGMPATVVMRTKDEGVANQYLPSRQGAATQPSTSTDRSGGSVSATERLRRLREGR